MNEYTSTGAQRSGVQRRWVSAVDRPSVAPRVWTTARVLIAFVCAAMAAVFVAIFVWLMSGCGAFVGQATKEHACPVDCGGGYCCAAYEECAYGPRRCIPRWTSGVARDAGADR